jgi:hypothetical protein
MSTTLSSEGSEKLVSEGDQSPDQGSEENNSEHPNQHNSSTSPSSPSNSSPYSPSSVHLELEDDRGGERQSGGEVGVGDRQSPVSQGENGEKGEGSSATAQGQPQPGSGGWDQAGGGGFSFGNSGVFSNDEMDRLDFSGAGNGSGGDGLGTLEGREDLSGGNSDFPMRNNDCDSRVRNNGEMGKGKRTLRQRSDNQDSSGENNYPNSVHADLSYSAGGPRNLSQVRFTNSAHEVQRQQLG